MEHLALEIFDLGTGATGSKFAFLEPDASISVTKTSNVFGKGDVWTHQFTLNTVANAHIFCSAGDLHGSRLHDQIDYRRARLWMGGLPAFLGYLRLGDEAEVDEDGNVDVSLESGHKTFDDLIEGAKANQVPLMGEVMYGVALWRKRYVNIGLKIGLSATYGDGRTTEPKLLQHDHTRSSIPGDLSDDIIPFVADGEDDNVAVQDYPRMVFPTGTFASQTPGKSGTINCLNVQEPYTEDVNGNPQHPYCNVALCYQKYGYDKKYQNGTVKPDYSSEPEPMRGYETMPANRVNSAPNFYVIYWLRCLMKHLGIHVEENQMLDMQDLRRLFMVNTRCAYKVPKHVRKTPTDEFDKKIGRYKFLSGKRLIPEQFAPHEYDRWNNPKKLVKIEDCAFTVGDGYQVTEWDGPDITGFVATTWEVAGLQEAQKTDYETQNNWLHDAIATSECFPDVDISEVIKALEDGFGIRFLFSDDYQRVRIVLLKNIFQGKEVQEIKCDITEVSKTENSIRGFRMTYGDSDDTHFYYKGFADKLPHKKELWQDNSDTHDYSQWNLNAAYKNLLNRVSAFDKTCYVTPDTGNAWGIKVDKNAKRYEDLHPSLFEYAGFMDAEDGDCTGEEETIETITVGFKPAIMNDTNWENERSTGTEEQRFALFVDEQMRPRRPDLGDLDSKKSYNDPDAYYDVDGKLYGSGNFTNMMADDGIVKPGEFAITSDVYAQASGLWADIYLPIGPYGSNTGKVSGVSIDGHANEGFRLYLQDNYEPNDDGVSPIETHDWGLTLGIMRGSGSDAYVRYSPDPDDGEGNDTWEAKAGSSVTAHPDTCDNYGNMWDYNGQDPEVGSKEGRFSLKLRAEKLNPYFSPVIKTKEEAGKIMNDMFSTANTDLLNRPKVTHAALRAAGWNCPGDGHETVYGQTYTLDLSDGKSHFILFTPIRQNGTVISPFDLYDYYRSKLEDHAASELAALDTQHLILDVDTTDQRAEMLRLLQAFYYAGDGEAVQPVATPEDMRYLAIEKKDLRQRGLMDQFYKEYSYWVRNARIANMTVRMELAQVLNIDMTKRVKVGDVMGFVKKMQYTVSNQTGLGLVTMEIMYI